MSVSASSAAFVVPPAPRSRSGAIRPSSRSLTTSSAPLFSKLSAMGLPI